VTKQSGTGTDPRGMDPDGHVIRTMFTVPAVYLKSGREFCLTSTENSFKLQSARGERHPRQANNCLRA